MSTGDRFNQGKPKWSFVDFNSLEDMVRVLEYGANKYSKDNWKKGLPYTEISESLIRHLISFLNGEDNDDESGISHVGHIMCNAMFLSYMYKNRKDLDDRPKNKNYEINKTIVRSDRTKARRTWHDETYRDVRKSSLEK